MNLYLLPILAIVVGVIIALLIKKQKNIGTKLLLSFSGAFLLSLTFFELLPEVYEHLDGRTTGLFVMGGILLQIILEFLSQGAEHGHVHHNEDTTKFPWLLFISLCIHSFLEGFPIHEHNHMVYGVLIHKIPIATLISAFLFQSKFSTLQITAFLILFAAMTPFGTFISNNADIDSHDITMINAIVIGIFLHISTTILFESTEGHKFNFSKLISIILGAGIAYLI